MVAAAARQATVIFRRSRERLKLSSLSREETALSASACSGHMFLVQALQEPHSGQGAETDPLLSGGFSQLLKGLCVQAQGNPCLQRPLEAQADGLGVGREVGDIVTVPEGSLLLPTLEHGNLVGFGVLGGHDLMSSC